MECGIFAIIGVIVGAVLSKKDIKLNFTKKRKKREVNEADELTVAKQWENLLNYDGGR